MRIRHAERPRLVVHLLDELRNRARRRLRKRDGRAVVRDEHHAAEELVRREEIAGGKLQRAVLRLIRVLRNHDVLVAAEQVKRQEACHDLCHARGRALRVRIFFIDDAPCRRLDDDGRLRGNRRYTVRLCRKHGFHRHEPRAEREQKNQTLPQSCVLSSRFQTPSIIQEAPLSFQVRRFVI